MDSPLRTIITEREKELELLEEAEEKETGKIRTAEDIAKRKAEAEKARKVWVFEFFEMITDREMTEEEYQEYISIFDNPKTRRGWNLKNFIKGDKGQEIEVKKHDKVEQAG